MMHGPHVDRLQCWVKEKKCSKKSPLQFCDETDMTNSQSTDVAMVVPHNPFLLKKYDCHINVEYCSSVLALKYIHKYIHKGHDRVRMKMKQHEANEVEKYIDSRYIGPMEAAWRLNAIPLHNRSLDDQQYVTFEGYEERILNQDHVGWVDLNSHDVAARSILYRYVPDGYTWNTKSKKWTPRKRAAKIVGHIINVSPTDSQRFFLN